ncbi:MAG: hypothetical protein Q9159_000402 [Coniocarpon cinnabarinum]
MKMRPALLYAICAGAMVCLLLVLRVAYALGRKLGRFYVEEVRPHANYPLLITHRAGTTNITILDSTLLILYIVANVSFLLFRAHDYNSVATRSALLFVANLVLLSAGGSTNLVIDKVLKLEKATCDLAHRWIGRTAAIEGAIHGLIYLTKSPRSPRRGDLPVRLFARLSEVFD